TTGLSTTKPYLLFVDNIGPALEIISPAEKEDAFGVVRVTGKIDDAVGLQKLSYEWNGETIDIPLRPGDPYWTADVSISPQNRAPVFRVTAVDKSGNITTLTRRFQDNRPLKAPSILVDAPAAAVLNALPLYEAVYGRITPGFIPESILIDGVVEEIPAQPGFRIPYDLIPPGRSTLRLWAKAQDGTVGAPFQLRINKPAPAPLLTEEIPPPEPEASPQASPQASPIIISGPAAYSYIRDSLVLKGNVARSRGAAGAPVLDDSVIAGLAEAADISEAAELSAETGTAEEAAPPSALAGEYAALLARGPITLQFRLFPEDSWKNISLTGSGAFESQISIAHIEEGPIHLELRTIQGGVEHIPLYHPLNRAVTVPEIRFLSPTAEDVINGNVTVSGQVLSYVPITDISYSLDGESYTPLTIKTGYQRAEFSLVCDFTTLEAAGGIFQIRVRDSGGKVFDKVLTAKVNNRDDIPSLILNQPGNGDVITGNFEISGIAFDDDGIASVYWRIRKKDSPAEDPAAAEPAEGAEEPEIPGGDLEFNRVLTDQSFHIPVALFSQISDGEHLIEIYAEDIYGVRSEVLSTTIKVSTAPPTAQVIEPAMDIYNRSTIFIKGSAEDANGIEAVWISMDNGNTYQKTDGAEEWQLSLNTKAYADGVYAVLVRVVDKYGVEALSDTLLNIDNSPPELSFGSPENGESTGTTLQIAARVQDNIEIRDLSLELIGVTDTDHRSNYEIENTLVILKSIDVSQLPPGEYNVRLSAADLAGNLSVITRNINITTEVSASEAALFNPLPGETHSGPVSISGRVSGAIIPDKVQLWANQQALSMVEVDRYGYFHYE
ncbi:MAG: neuraminidase, partial [Spirochaetaceae bacterium]|nr:neuraminidase [Spirochaetaceae bacterium]